MSLRECFKSDGQPKKKFADRTQAQQWVWDALDFDVRLVAYECSLCKYWHVGNVR